jgi:flagellar protein FliO/FliZ
VDTLFTALRVLVSLAVVVGLLWFVQRKSVRWTRKKAPEKISVLGKQSLGSKAHVLIVEADGTRFILGVTERGVSVLKSRESAMFADELAAADETDAAQFAALTHGDAAIAQPLAASIAEAVARPAVVSVAAEFVAQPSAVPVAEVDGQPSAVPVAEVDVQPSAVPVAEVDVQPSAVPVAEIVVQPSAVPFEIVAQPVAVVVRPTVAPRVDIAQSTVATEARFAEVYERSVAPFAAQFAAQFAEADAEPAATPAAAFVPLDEFSALSSAERARAATIDEPTYAVTGEPAQVGATPAVATTAAPATVATAATAATGATAATAAPAPQPLAYPPVSIKPPIPFGRPARLSKIAFTPAEPITAASFMDSIRSPETWKRAAQTLRAPK